MPEEDRDTDPYQGTEGQPPGREGVPSDQRQQQRLVVVEVVDRIEHTAQKSE